MCKASVEAPLTRDAEKGDVTRLGFSPHGFPQFERIEDQKYGAGMVTCALTGQKLKFEHLPRQAQQKYGVPASFTAVFIEDAGDVPDKIFLEDGRLIDLGDFVWEDGIQEDVVVTMLEMLSAKERKTVLDAIAGRSNPKVVDDSPLPALCVGH